jgi:glycosyltransferase involved in cell wall biosynthesis
MTEWAFRRAAWARAMVERPAMAPGAPPSFTVVEPNLRAGEHVPFNAGLLQIVRAAYPDAAIRFVAQAEHARLVEEELARAGPCGIRFEPARWPPPPARFLGQVAADTRRLRPIADDLARAPDGRLVLASAVPSTIYALKLVRARLGRRMPRSYAVLHGVLSEVWGWRSRNPWVRAQNMAAALLFPGNGAIVYLVLEPHIGGELARRWPQLAAHIAVLPHPVPPAPAAPREVALEAPIRVGFLGLASRAKGYDTFVDLARAVAARQGVAAEFHAIGRRAPDAPADDSCLATPASRERLPRERYVELARRMHYMCVPFRKEAYRYVASGVLADAIAYRVPVIAFDLPAIAEIARSHGEIGHICRDEADMAKTIEAIARAPDRERYRRQCAALDSVRRSRQPEALAPAWRRICGE